MSDRKVDIRYLQHSAAIYVRTVYDAIAELITNSDDAYNRMSGNETGEIIIEHRGKYGRQKTAAQITVRDQATGMTAGRMKRIAVFGRKTSTSGDRGFFGSGLKNCQNIADIIIESIVDSLYYKGTMSFVQEANIQVSEKHKVASRSDRKRMCIPAGNGTSVTLLLKETVSLPRIITMKEELPYLYVLRKICDVNSNRRIILVNANSGARYNIRYSKPNGELVHDEEFKVNGHKARFKLFRSEEKLEDIHDSKTGKSGIAVVSDRICHELTFFNTHCRNNPFATHYFGELRCDKISALLKNYDPFNPTKDNPVLVVEPTRQGLNTEHPFVEKLFGLPEKVLRKCLDDDVKKAREEENSIVSTKTRSFFNKVAKYMSQLFDDGTNAEEELYPRGRTGELTIQENGILIVPDHVKVAKKMDRVVTVYALKNSVKATDELKVTVDGEYATIKQIKKLKEHPKHDDRYITYFTVHAEKATDFSTIDVQVGNLKEEIILEIVRKYKREFAHPLEFMKKNEFTEGEHELRLFAHEDIMRGKEKLKFKISVVDGKGVEILGKTSTRIITCQEGTNYATGAVNIRCKGLGSTAIVEAKLGTYKAKTVVKVVNPKIVRKTPYDVELVEQEGMRFRWDDKHKLLISATHPAIAPYLGKAPNYSGQDTPVARVVLQDIIADALVKKSIQERSAKGHIFGFAGKTEENILENVSAERERELLKIIKNIRKMA